MDEKSKLPELDTRLDKIIELLHQIEGITLNQQQVLCADFIEQGDLSIVEEMADNKENIMTEVEQTEEAFEVLYNEAKVDINSKSYIAKLQENISEVLRLKDSIIRLEKANMELMTKDLRVKLGKFTIPKPAQEVVNMYKRTTRVQPL
ncbi:MAG: hypothetical protein ATN34_04185 [Epulopiscium sp. Nele67-Bin002]|nr:MAG: hypothetical protein ATN33_07410 [Epulopiscium sp. Nele67-Bin001]OON92540.1 MAG: hypothetical protein ATN34_04185 [Epulopiscium sp. Nele67-Bin002]